MACPDFDCSSIPEGTNLPAFKDSKRYVGERLREQLKNNDSDGVAEKEEDEEEKILKFSKKGALGWMSLFKDLVETNESRIPPPKIMTLERARGLYQLIKKFGRETVANVFRKAAQTSFLNGKGKNKFVASFDWLLEEKNFVNVYEGNFFC